VANNDLDEQRRRWEVERNWDALKLFRVLQVLHDAYCSDGNHLGGACALPCTRLELDCGPKRGGRVGGALLLSLLGMVYLMVCALAPMSVEFSSTGVAMLMVLIAILFFGGLGVFVGDAADFF
jgi:hypothetical protein